MRALPIHMDLKAGGYNMPNSNMQLGMLRADFSDLENVIEHMTQALTKLTIEHKNLTLAARAGQISMQDYDQQLAEFIRKDIAKQLAIIRHLTIRRARGCMKGDDIGAAASAVYRRSYKDQLGGNINISGNGRRMSNQRRPYRQGHQRDVSDRTRQINEYYGLDRAFILRILEVGRDAFFAESSNGLKGRGSRASWGRRGAMAAHGFFHTMSADMEQAAERLGQDISQYVEKLISK